MKHFVSAAVLAAGTLIAGLAGAPSPALAKNQIVLGLTFDKTGLYASTGRPTEIAVDIAVKEINDAGGINGMPIKLVKFDTGGDPKQAVAAVRKFAEDDKALAIIGPFSSSEARVAFPVGEREKIVQIPNASSAPHLADRYSYAFRDTENEFLQFSRVVETLKKRNMLKKSVAIMYGTDDVVSKVVGLKIMKPILEKNGVKITGPIGFQSKAFDLSPQVSQLKGKKIDYVAVGGLVPVTIRVLKELRRQGIETPLIGSQIWADPEIIDKFGKDGDGSVFVTWFWYKRDARAKAFTAKFEEGIKKAGIKDKPFPHHVDAAAYDIVYILKDAMEAAKITGDPSKLKAERTKIRDTLGKLTYNGVVGKICFEKTGDAELPGYVITMENSQWKLLDSYPAKTCAH